MEDEQRLRYLDRSGLVEFRSDEGVLRISLVMALGNDGNPAIRWDGIARTEIFRGDAERIEVATVGLKARCRELRHGRNPEITVPKVGRREGRRGGGDHLREPPIAENGQLGLCLMGLREELSLIFV
ncbi:hypothetical protein NL676_039240 [Syzygium grande]|nr:hypothetical protein NL676_039240 [Syzygium grande]